MNWLRIGSWIVWVDRVDIFLYKRAINVNPHFVSVHRYLKALGSRMDLLHSFE